MTQSDSSRVTQTEETAAVNTYQLSCTACPFETTVDGDSIDALDAADAHRNAYGNAITDHFVNIAIDE